MRRIILLVLVSAFLMAVARSGAIPACWFSWYQPKLPE
ncbi:MAG TPA: cyclic lactone autoinducer peptide [Syntrophomonadaceae bacterium]|nr:cyclic lactone autoinducer peptide [Syntrophomonadaceae bacterium]